MADLTRLSVKALSGRAFSKAERSERQIQSQAGCSPSARTTAATA